MKKLTVILFLFMAIIGCLNAQTLNEQINLAKYAQANKELPPPAPGEKRVAFMGNSITEAWVHNSPEFFSQNYYIGRGISGQTTTQMLLRFRPDILDLQPNVVMIFAGINDIAENTGVYDPDFTFGNIVSMAQLAKANNMKVIIASLVPAKEATWHPHVTDIPAKVVALNARLKEYALANDITYLDFYDALQDGTGIMRKELSEDGLHPNAEGYAIMERIAKPVIDKILDESVQN